MRIMGNEKETQRNERNMSQRGTECEVKTCKRLDSFVGSRTLEGLTASGGGSPLSSQLAQQLASLSMHVVRPCFPARGL